MRLEDMSDASKTCPLHFIIVLDSSLLPEAEFNPVTKRV